MFSKVVVAFHENEQISVVWEMINSGYNFILLIAPKLLCLLQISSMIIAKIYLLQFIFKLQKDQKYCNSFPLILLADFP